MANNFYYLHFGLIDLLEVPTVVNLGLKQKMSICASKSRQSRKQKKSYYTNLIWATTFISNTFHSFGGFEASFFAHLKFIRKKRLTLSITLK